MRRDVIILTGSGNYGRYTTADTINTATTTDILNSGAIGIYGLAMNDADTAGNANKEVLICNSSGTPAAGVTKIATFISGGGNLVRFAQGGANGFPVSTGMFNIRGIRSILKQSFVTGIRGVTYFGYNGSTGALNLPTITQNSEALILAITAEGTTEDKIREQESYGALLTASEAAYDILVALATSVNGATNKTHSAYIVSNSASVADFTGTGTAILYTKGSTTARFMLQDATAGWVASTGTAAVGNIFQVPHENMINVTFTANILGTAAGRHIISINGTIYNVADAGTAAQNATAVAAAINAGSQAKAITSGTSDVTIIVNAATYAAKILVVYSADDSAWTEATLTVTTTTGEVVPTIYKAATVASAAATFELDRAFEGETMYALGGVTASIHTGIAAAPTEYGLKMVVSVVGEVYGYALQQMLQYATMTYSINPAYGFGSGNSVVSLEQKELAYRGQMDSIDVRMKQLTKFADAIVSYDVYSIICENRTTDSGANNNKQELNTIVICVPIFLTSTTKTPQTALELLLTGIASAVGGGVAINF